MATLDERERKGALSQTLRRDVNERIADKTSPAADPTEPLNLLSECFDRDCVDQLWLRRSEYEEIRYFPVKPGDVLPEIERVVERNDRYEVVEKFEEGGRIAAARDPRSDGQ